jgi:hypothetical protein
MPLEDLIAQLEEALLIVATETRELSGVVPTVAQEVPSKAENFLSHLWI